MLLSNGNGAGWGGSAQVTGSAETKKKIWLANKKNKIDEKKQADADEPTSDLATTTTAATSNNDSVARASVGR